MSSSSDDVIVRRALRRLGTSLCGRYSILRLIGIGGMAAVYAGVHRNGHAVAIKILHERLVSDPEIERLFRREAQLANKINHPGVISVIDDDVAEDGCVFLVMPLLQGETLRARAERNGRKLPVGEVVAIAHALLQTLAEAHAKKIVHRDIKPENVFLTTAGEVRVLDFGIGRFFETAESTTATRSGRALGTPAFIAPEQALGRLRDVDGRTDLWAVGATMFSLLSGRYVHEAESATEVSVLAATRTARAIREVAPEVPVATAELIDRALKFRREERWGSAEEMDRGLLAWEASSAKSGARFPSVPASEVEPTDDVDDVPTRVPQVRDVPSHGTLDETSAPTDEIPGTPTRTTTGALVAPAQSNSPRLGEDRACGRRRRGRPCNLNPIETRWSKVKAALRTIGAHRLKDRAQTIVIASIWSPGCNEPPVTLRGSRVGGPLDPGERYDFLLSTISGR